MGKEYKALDNLLIMREDGEIDKETFLRRKEIRETNIKVIKEKINELEERIKRSQAMDDKRRLANIKNFSTKWEQTDSIELKNQFLRMIIDNIIYKRE